MREWTITIRVDGPDENPFRLANLVPLSEIQRLLRETPFKAIGIEVEPA